MSKKKRTWVILAAVVAFLAVAAWGGWLWLLARTGPAVRQLPQLVHNRVDAHGGAYVKLADMPAALKEAVVDTEDNSFWGNLGVDPSGIARSVLADITSGTYQEGGSTITQQLARNLLLTPNKTIIRKIKEALLALVITHTYSKNDILEMYLNEVYLGHGAYGVEKAARVYFGADAGSLSPAQCTLLAGIPQGPSLFDPLENLEASRTRQRIVLDSMVQERDYTAEQADEVFAQPLNLVK